MQTKAKSFFQQGQWLIWIAIDSPIKPALIVMPNDWKVKKAEKKFPQSKKCLDRFSEASISQEYCVNRVKNFAEKKTFLLISNIVLNLIFTSLRSESTFI
jgi:hypothetical protein